MGIFDSILGSVIGGGGNSMLSPILAEVLGGGGNNQQTSGQPGIAGLVERFVQAGHGDAVNSWVGNGANQPIEPSALQHVFGEGQINQWAQQAGVNPQELLGQLAQFLPHAINTMTPNGNVQQGGPAAQEGPAQDSPFDGPGVA